jgi:hypothetical protein
MISAAMKNGFPFRQKSFYGHIIVQRYEFFALFYWQSGFSTVTGNILLSFGVHPQTSRWNIHKARVLKFRHNFRDWDCSGAIKNYMYMPLLIYYTTYMIPLSIRIGIDEET